MRVLKPTTPKPIQAKVLKPKPKVVPKIKPVPVVEKAVPETKVQGQQIKTPVAKKETTSAEKLAITKPKKVSAGLQDEVPVSEKSTGTEGDAFQQQMANDPFAQMQENDPLKQQMGNDPFTQLVNQPRTVKEEVIEEKIATNTSAVITEEIVVGNLDTTKAAKNTTTQQNVGTMQGTTSLVNQPKVEKEEASEEKTIANTSGSATGKVTGNSVTAIAAKNTTAQQNEGEEQVATNSPEAAIGSITKMQPLQMFSKMKTATTAVGQAQQNQVSAAQEGMEEITIPTGINAASEVAGPTIKPFKKGKLPTFETPSAAKKVSADKTAAAVDETTAVAPITAVSTAKGAFVGSIQQSRGNLSNVQSAAQSDLGAQPTASLDAAGNPAQIEANSVQAQQSVGNELGTAQQVTAQDFGESGMFPEQAHKKAKVNLNTELTAQRESLLTDDKTMPSFDGVETANLNQELTARYQNEITTAENDMQVAGTSKDAGIVAENDKQQQEMAAATEEAKTKQRLERGKGQQDVANQKENWQAENQKIKLDAEGQLTKEQLKNEADITKKQTDGNQQITDTYAQADKDIDAKTKEADQKVADKEKEGAQKEEKGWLDSAIDWVGEQFDKIKNAVNAIFDMLRAAVKALVSWAKEKASSIINAVRDFAIKAVQVFGEIAKAVVNVALAAFPEAAKKFNTIIDQQVANTITVINKVAEVLEKTVHALLDVVGKVIDAVLAVYQKAINMVLDVLEAITVGALILIQKIGWLGSAAKESPDHFFPQMASELLGQDVEEPLDNEIPKVFGLTMDDVKKNDALAAQGEAIEIGMPSAEGVDNSVLEKDSYVASDFDVPVQDDLQFNDAVLAEIASMPEGVPVEISGTTDDAHGIAAVKAGTTPEAVATNTATEETAQEPLITTEYIESLTPKDKEESGWVGPYHSVMDRAQGAAGAMLDAVKTWWGENKIAIIAALVLGIAGLIAANILTGGAIMAALPLLLNLLSIFFAADALYQLGKHFKSYLSKTWDGDIKGGSKSMARGLAALAIELVFALMFGAKGVFKAVKAGMKTAKGGIKATQKAVVKGAKGFVKGQAKNAKQLLTVTKDGAKTAFKNGKIAMKGIKGGSVKGAKSLQAAGKTLLKQLGFDRFRITRKGKRFKLEGHVNPWVLLASGDIKHVDKDRAKGLKVGDELDGGILIGKKDIPTGNGAKGIDGKDVTGSSFVKQLDADKGKASKMFKDLKDESFQFKNQKILQGGKGVLRNPKFRENYIKWLKSQGVKLSPLALKFISIHHIVPNFIKGIDDLEPFLKMLKKQAKFDIDDLINSIGLPTTNLDDLAKRLSKLKNNVDDSFENIRKEFKLDPNVTKQELKKAIKELEEFKNKSIHDNYHNKYSAELRKQMISFSDDFDDLAEIGLPNSSLNKLVGKFEKYFGGLVNDLNSGKILE